MGPQPHSVATLKTPVAPLGQYDVTRDGFLGFSFDMLCLIETDGVSAGFYLDACIQGKSCGHNIKRRSRQHGKRVFFVFLKYTRRGFHGLF